MFSAFRKALPLTVRERYSNRMLRREVVVFLARHADFFFPVFRQYIAATYNGEDAVVYQGGHPIALGPFSFKEYLLYMLQHNTWGDEMILAVLAHMWRCRVTVVNSKSLTELRFFHQKPLEQADVVLVYNGTSHYIGTGENESLLLFTVLI